MGIHESNPVGVIWFGIKSCREKAICGSDAARFPALAEGYCAGTIEERKRPTSLSRKYTPSYSGLGRKKKKEKRKKKKTHPR